MDVATDLSELPSKLWGAADELRANSSLSRPIWLTTKNDKALYERRNHSTWAVPDDEIEGFVQERFGGHR